MNSSLWLGKHLWSFPSLAVSVPLLLRTCLEPKGSLKLWGSSTQAIIHQSWSLWGSPHLRELWEFDHLGNIIASSLNMHKQYFFKHQKKTGKQGLVIPKCRSHNSKLSLTPKNLYSGIVASGWQVTTVLLLTKLVGKSAKTSHPRLYFLPLETNAFHWPSHYW